MIKTITRKSSLSLLIALHLAVTGCTRYSGVAAGHVRFDDESPLTSGAIEFRNVLDGSCFTSRINSEGFFQPANLIGIIGLPAGTYDVVIVQIVLTEDLAKKDHSHGHTVPRRYADYHSSDLAITVLDHQTNSIEIIIPADL